MRYKVLSACPGRLRVKWVNRSLALQLLEKERSSCQVEIYQFSFRPRSGNLLIYYDRSCGVDSIYAWLDHLLAVTAPTCSVGEDFPSSKKRKPPGKEGRLRRLIGNLQQNSGLLKTEPREGLAFLKSDQLELAWHSLNASEVANLLNAHPDGGLSQKESLERLKKFGGNQIAEATRVSEFMLFSKQFLNIPVALLGASAVISVMTGGVADAGVILGVVSINAFVGFFTERQAERAIAALANVAPKQAKVIRENNTQLISAEKLVPGDIIKLEPGFFIPADSRIIRAQQLSIDESSLTGESFPVLKQVKPLLRDDIPLAERSNLAYMGTMVTSGSGEALIVATGQATELGRLQNLADSAKSPDTPMQRQLDQLGTQLAYLSSGICLMLIPIGLLRQMPLMELLKTSISLAVAAVPEGLPAVATSILALGVKDMKRHNVLVRRLDAIENLGQVQAFCMDKTGTLTQNKMTAVTCQLNDERIHLPYGNTDEIESTEVFSCPHLYKLSEIATLCSDSEIKYHGEGFHFIGSATENALLDLAVRCKVDVPKLRASYPRMETMYRTESRHYMKTIHQNSGRFVVAVKGSPLEVVELCQWYRHGQGIEPITSDFRDQVSRYNDQFGQDALRVLAVAYSESDTLPGEDDEGNLVWLGLVGLIDPLRKGMSNLMEEIRGAGIRTVMITGDQSSTAYAIGRSLNLSGGASLEAVDSSHLNQVPPELLKALVKDAHVYSRVSPTHKLQIVQALQESGQVVAMTGDGINDGPALKASDVGVAMGKGGTEVALAASDIVLEDDNLESMLVALGKGRAIYSNIRKTIHFLLSTNLSEIETMVICVSAGWGQPINPMQLLWINLVTDIFPGLGLALEPPSKDVLQQTPRDPKQPIIDRDDYVQLFRESFFITASALVAYRVGVRLYGQGPEASALAFHSLSTAQLFHTLHCRDEEKSIWERKPRNQYLWGALALSFTLQFATTVFPITRRILGVSPLRGRDVLIITGASVAPLLVNDVYKVAQRSRRLSPQKPGSMLGRIATIIRSKGIRKS